MPSVPFDSQARVGRFRDQHWRVDSVIKTHGPEFDQSRLHYLGAPMGADLMGAVLALEKQITRSDDIAPVFARTARRFELQAIVAEKQGRTTTAGDAFFAASVLYSGAQWPIFARTELLSALERKKIDCYANFISVADHRIEAVRISYDASTARMVVMTLGSKRSILYLLGHLRGGDHDDAPLPPLEGRRVTRAGRAQPMHGGLHVCDQRTAPGGAVASWLPLAPCAPAMRQNARLRAPLARTPPDARRPGAPLCPPPSREAHR